jgi:hypothetical protein
MNPYQTPRECSLTPLEGGGSSGDRVRNFTGGYYRALGWLAIATTVISVATAYWTGWLHFDLSFLIWFWLSNCLRRGSRAARKWAIAIFLLVSGFCFLSPFLSTASAGLGDMRFSRGHPAFYAIMGMVWLIFAIPGIMLLSGSGKAAFAKKPQ